MKPSNRTAPAKAAGTALVSTPAIEHAAGASEARAFIQSLHGRGVMTCEDAAQAFADTLGEIVCAGSAADWNDEVQARFEGFAQHIGGALHEWVKP
ncbi:hypothetical protein [Niveibacterium sp.]|uniref:hypothetical protein n=1 Tax=Niveibacterium sp. TaxID=2017444 RepID=UPI0035B1F201